MISSSSISLHEVVRSLSISCDVGIPTNGSPVMPRYPDPEERRRLRLHQRGLRGVARLPLPLGRPPGPGSNGERDHRPHLRPVHPPAAVARLPAAI